MFAAWLKFSCALLCALALSLCEAAGERARVDAEEAGTEWSRTAKPDAAWAQVDDRESRLRASGRPPSCRSQTASAEGRSGSGVVRLLI
jgi:hypothetical protein